MDLTLKKKSRDICTCIVLQATHYTTGTCKRLFFSLIVKARHAQPCSLHAALRTLGAQAPRRPAPGQQVSTTSSASEGAEGWPSRSERTPRLPSASREGPVSPPELIIVSVSIRLSWEACKAYSGSQCPRFLSLPSSSCQSSPSPQSSEKTSPPFQAEAGFPRPARALHCGGYQDAKTVQPILSGSRSAPSRQPMGVQINHLKHPMDGALRRQGGDCDRENLRQD